MKRIRHSALLATVLVPILLSTPALTETGKKTEGVDEQWLKTVVSIEQGSDLTKTQPIGTGFLVASPSNHLLLVTAKHVIAEENGKVRPLLAYRFNQKTGPSLVVSDQHMNQYAGDWFLSESADVACRFIVTGDVLDILNIPQDRFLISDRVLPGARVLIPGFPLGLRSTDHSQPILRDGIVARSSSESIILDAFVFPGNSGGLVLYAPVFTLKSGGGIEIGNPSLSEERVIGLVSSNISYVEPATSVRTGRPRVTFEENSGLSNVVPADRILDLLNRDDVRALDAALNLKPK